MRNREYEQIRDLEIKIEPSQHLSYQYDKTTEYYQGNLIPLPKDLLNLVMDYLDFSDILEINTLDQASLSQYPPMDRFMQQRNQTRYDEDTFNRYTIDLNETKTAKANAPQIKKLETQLIENRVKLERINQECCCSVSESCCAGTVLGGACATGILVGCFFPLMGIIGCCSLGGGCCACCHCTAVKAYLCSVGIVDAAGMASTYAPSVECGTLSWITTVAVEGAGCIGGSLWSLIDRCCVKYNITTDEKALKTLNNESFGPLNQLLDQPPTIVALSLERTNNRVDDSVEIKHAPLKTYSTTETSLLAQAPSLIKRYGSSNGFSLFQPVITETTANPTPSTSSNDSNTSNETTSTDYAFLF